MNIVIDITEELYEQCKNIDSIAKLKQIRKNLTDAVKYGIPLPKNHGRLIDADALYEDLIFPNKQFDKTFKNILDDAQTIIEADKGNKNDKRRSNRTN